MVVVFDSAVVYGVSIGLGSDGSVRYFSIYGEGQLVYFHSFVDMVSHQLGAFCIRKLVR